MALKKLAPRSAVKYFVAWTYSFGGILRREVPQYDRAGLYIQAVFSIACWFAWEWWQVPPGWSVAALALAAVLMTVRANRFTKAEQVIWVLIGFALFVGESRAIYQDRADHDRQQLAESRRQADQFSQTLTNFSQARDLNSRQFIELQNTISAANKAQAIVRAFQPSSPIVGTRPVELSLKQRAQILSSDVLTFAADRQLHEVASPKQETWDKDVAALIFYSNQTIALYSQRFAARVIAMRDELARNGLSSQRLDQMYEHPTNSLGIRTVGEEIGALAERIKQPE